MRLPQGPDGFSKRWTSSQSNAMYSYFWPAKKPKAIVLLVHGHGTYITYEYLRSVGKLGIERKYRCVPLARSFYVLATPALR